MQPRIIYEQGVREDAFSLVFRFKGMRQWFRLGRMKQCCISLFHKYIAIATPRTKQHFICSHSGSASFAAADFEKLLLLANVTEVVSAIGFHTHNRVSSPHLFPS
jgi:hypothetical protein